MHIAVFSDAYHPRVNGLVSSIDEFAKELRTRGHKVLIVCPSYPPQQMDGVIDQEGVLRVPSGTAIVSKEDRLALPWWAAEVFAQINAFKPDVVHVQTEFSLGFLGRRYCRKSGIPVISTCHTHYEMYINNYIPFLPGWTGRLAARRFMRLIYKNDDYVITPSKQIANMLKSYGIEREFHIIPTGVDGSLFNPKPDKARLLRQQLAMQYPSLETGPILLFVGRIGYEKNIRLLIESFLLVQREVPDAKLLFVGEGPALLALKKITHEKHLANHVVFLGYVPRRELPAYYSMAELFIFPSITETQGLVTIEAMLCGTPVVGINEMGTAEVMKGEKGGLLSSNDVVEYSEKVACLLKNQDLRTRKSQEAIERGKHWTIEASCTKLLELYASVAAQMKHAEVRD